MKIGHCATCEGPSLRLFRGCCRRCFDAHRRSVETGKTTWEALVASGVVSMPQTRQEASDAFFRRMRQ